MVKAEKLGSLAHALNYPEGVPEGAADFTFLVDGLEVRASVQARGIVLQFMLACSEDLLPELAQYAAGRFLREDATLAWDAPRATLFLWQELPPSADEGALRQGFGRFADSCEWWLARCAEKEVPQSVFPDVLIRP